MKPNSINYLKPVKEEFGLKMHLSQHRRLSMKKGCIKIITAAFAFLLLPSIASAQKGTINGKVVGSEGALEAATITIGKTGLVTDKNGQFAITLSPGRHTLVVTHVGYEAVTQEVEVVSGASPTLAITLTPVKNLGEVVMLGSRSLVQRTNLNTVVPVDVFSAEQLVQTGQVSLAQMLNFAAPSFNASRPTNNESVTLRGLNPDQLLILVNGTRRHNMAYITAAGARGILGPGTVANDINSIPFSAVEKIEILRDGASAQYGSDAIAGVINIHLKKSTGKMSVQMQTGQFYQGDGENFALGINKGFSLHKKGFLNISADFRFNNSTYRGGPHTGTVYKNIPATSTPAAAQKLKAEDDSLVRANNFDRNKVSNGGSSKITRGGILLNAGYSVGKNTELFWTAGVNTRNSITPTGYTFPKNANRINPDLFPNGFRSNGNHQATDFSGIAGIKGETQNSWRWEYTTAYGINSDRYYSNNTNNASQYYRWGKDAPTSFHTSTLIYGQLTNNLQFSKNLSSNPTGSSNLSMGAEWRLENYQLKEGEEGAWKNYDSTGRKQGGAGGLTISPADAVKKSRNVAAVYVDFETEFNRRFLVDLAARYEHYSDFGGNLAGKIATRYKFSDRFLIRASVNNGFRAPSLQQRYFSTTTRSLIVRGLEIIPATTGTFRNNSPEAAAFGIPSLQAERSVNVSAGVTAALSNSIRMTVDIYWIQIKNRIVASGRFDTSNSEVKEILRPFPDITQAQFYVNAINTKTRGFDVVFNGSWKIRKANLLAIFAANFTQNRLFGNIKTAGKLTASEVNENTLFGREERARLEIGQPDSKIILSLNYKINKFGILVRNTRFGKTGIRSNTPALNPDENFFPKILTDLNFSYIPKQWLTFTAGANNIFDVYPDRIRDYRNTQDGTLIYSLEASPFGFYGGYYFVGIGLQLQKR